MVQPSLKEKTKKGLIWGGISNGGQQLLGMIFGIYLARILNAEDYGLVGMLAIFTAIASSLINSGFTVALTNKENPKHEDYNAVFWFTFYAGLILYIVLYFSAPLIANFYDRTELIVLARILFISFLFSGISLVPHAILFKKLMVKQQAQIDLFALCISGLTGIVLALNGYSYWALAIQNLVYICMGSIIRLIIVKWKPSLPVDFTPLKELFNFSFRILITNIFVQINNNVFSVILGKFYNADLVGYYTQGYKWMMMGNSTLTGMISSVAQPVLVEVQNDKARQLHIFRKMIRFTAFVTFPCMLGLGLIAKEFITILLGEKWLPSAIILQLLCILGVIYPFWHLYTQYLLSAGKSDIFLKGNIAQGLLSLLVIWACSFGGLYWMIGGYISVYFVTLFYWHYHANKILGLTLKQFFSDIFPYFIITTCIIGFTALGTMYIQNIYLLITVRILIVAVLYSLILWLSKSAIFHESIHLLLRKK